MAKAKRSVSILLSLVIIVAGAFCTGVSAKAASFRSVDGKYNYSYACEVLRLVNNERSKYGLGELTMTEELTDGAMLRAAETSVSFSHTRPNGEQCFTAFSWSVTAGENIAYGQRSPSQVVNGWMNSSGHRANILNSAFKLIGIGCFEKNGVLYWAQAFSGGSGRAYNPSGEKSVSVEVSLTAGVQSKVNFKEEGASNPSVPPTTAPKTTIPKTTSPQTTAPKTTAPPTTKSYTTVNNTTKQQAITEKKGNSKIIRIIRYYFYRFFK